MHKYRVRFNGLRIIPKVDISQKAKGVIMPNPRDTIFYMKTNILQDFHICITLPLMQRTSENTFLEHWGSKLFKFYRGRTQRW